MPGAKNGERPYLAVPEPVFSGLFLGLFSGILAATLSIFIFYFVPITQPHPTCVLT